MKIDPQNPVSRTMPSPDASRVPVMAPRRRKASSAASGISALSGEDTVRLFQHAMRKFTLWPLNSPQLPEVRAPRVAALQQRVRSGNFKPDPQKVADAVVADHSRQASKA